MPPTKADRILRRYQQLKTARATWEPVWRDLGTYIVPRKTSVLLMRTPGTRQTAGVFDSTAIHANELLAASMQGALTPATVRWFRLKMRRRELNENDEVRAWLDLVSDELYLALQQSNFNSELQEVYIDLGAFGVAALFMDENDTPRNYPRFRGFRFHAEAIGGYVIAENGEGRVDTLYREVALSAAAAIEQFGGEDAVGPQIKAAYAEEPDRIVHVLHAVFPRELGRPGAYATVKPYASYWCSLEGDNTVLRESGYDTFPFMVPRWTKTSGEIYGRGPGHTALPDVKTMNRAKEMELEALALAIKPPMKQRDRGVVGTVRWQPGALNSVRDKDALEPMSSGTRWDVVQVKSQELRSSIQDIFFNSQLQFPSNQPMTATEIERRYELMQRVLGPTLGRVDAELLARVVERGVDMMLRRRVLPQPPAILIETERARQPADIDVEYVGPIARSQKAADAVAISSLYEVAAPIAGVVPDVLDTIDHDEAVRTVARARGVPERVMRPAADVNARRQQRAAEQEQERRKQDADRLSKVVRNTAPLLKGAAGVPDEVVQEALSGAQ